MDNILVITNTDINTSAGNITLLLRRAEAFSQVFSTHTTILVYKGIKQSYIKSTESYYSIKYEDKWKGIKSVIKQLKPEMIILYGDKIELLTYLIHSFLRKNNLDAKVLLDVQGAIEEIKEFPSSIKRKLFYPVYQLFFRLAISDVDGAFVVSDELEENCRTKTLNKRCNQDYYKVRCGLTEVRTPEAILSKRADIRHQLGIDENTLVFVYSGYRLPWQKVDSIIEEFKKIDIKFQNCFFAFFCNIDDEFNEKLRLAFPKGNYVLKLLSKEEYIDTLCACDVGYILRDYNETNRVAFPNKFSDYMAGGLMVALNGALSEPMRLLNQYDIPHIDTDNDDAETAINKLLKTRNNNLSQYYEKTNDVIKRELLYTVQIENAFNKEGVLNASEKR